MKLLKKIGSEINILMGKIIYKSHSGIIKCTIDLFFIIINGIKLSNFKIIENSIDISKMEDFEYSGNEFTKTKIFEDLPNIIVEIIKKERRSIEEYLGQNFVAENAISYLNTELPEWALNYDIYANIWHMDCHDGLRLLKIFVNLNDTSEEDGPLIYMDRKETKENFLLFWNRWTFDNVRKNKPISFASEKKFISIKGGYLIMDTGNCYHRASSPINGGYRKFLQITLYPKWLKNEERFVI